MAQTEPNLDHDISWFLLPSCWAKTVVALISFLCFANSYDGDFVFDDSEAIINNKVKKVCGPPVRKSTQSPHCSFDQNKYYQGLKMFSRDSEETLASRRKEFISHLRLYRAFYGGLADQLCGNELAAADGLPCWNGEDVVKSYTHRVVGSGIKAQSGNPEVRVKGADPVINQIIDKLKHVIQFWEILQVSGL